MLGTLGLPHILMRFMTVPDARAARKSIGWTVGLVGIFYVFVAIIGLGGRAILGPAGEKLGGKSGNLIAPYLAQHLGGRVKKQALNNAAKKVSKILEALAAARLGLKK